MDKLKEMVSEQALLMERLNVPTVHLLEALPEEERHAALTNWVKQVATAIIMEGAELMDWVPWKAWSQRAGNKTDIELWSPEHMREMRTEVIDILHFALEAAIILGMSTDDIHAEYMVKMGINHRRQDEGGY